MELLTSKQVLDLLNIKNRKVLGWLIQRDLLPRVVLGPKTFRYDRTDVERLIFRSKSEGILLTSKP